MARALELARRAWGHTHPNPMVGALIVESGQVVAEGWHHVAGQAHAEIEAFKALGRKPSADAELYVTLEPCSTHGSTGACTVAIIESGIRRVVVGALDPNPAHAGRALDVLRAAGVEVIQGVLAEECAELNLIFNHWILHQKPFLAAKIATTLDGKFAASNGHSKWVTGEAARGDVMRWRRYFPAIAVTAATALADNPSLTSRVDGAVWCPRRFILDRNLETVAEAKDLNVFTDAYASNTTLVCSDKADTKVALAQGLDLWPLPEVDGHLSLSAFQDRCAVEGVFGVYIEPGPSFATALIEERAVHYLFHYIAPKYMSDAAASGVGSLRGTQSMDAAIVLSKLQQETFGDDRLVRGYLNQSNT